MRYITHSLLTNPPRLFDKIPKDVIERYNKAMDLNEKLNIEYYRQKRLNPNISVSDIEIPCQKD